MKRYKLLKDLPTFKAGQLAYISKTGNLIAGFTGSLKMVIRFGTLMRMAILILHILMKMTHITSVVLSLAIPIALHKSAKKHATVN